jgi:hypothetical protein
VISIAGILQVLHKTDGEEKFGKGDYCRKAQNHLDECFLEGQKFVFRAKNSAQGQKFCPRARISSPGENFWGPKNSKFLALQNSAKSFTLCCGATLSKSARNYGIGRISGGQKFHNFRPYEIRLSP